MGSPPHRRGKGVVAPQPPAVLGITPAWAGKRSVELFLSVLSLDHPRVGGEKTRVFQQHFPAVGSPPHGRGKAHRHPSCPRRSGITPAWAGKRCWTSCSSARNPDYPRMGGEKVDPTGNDWYTQGSPPHKRGKVDVLFGGLVDGRITPAQAGKSSVPFLRSAPRKDHPCAGGEKPASGLDGKWQ